MAKHLRISIGGLLLAAGVILFILPGSMLFVLLGLIILSYDIPQARNWLKSCQNSMSRSARRLDKILLQRKLK